ncbi:MAG: tRNA (guanosine(46)-N7)-methyltransferase TrmB [Bacilli bacterium]|nr:tRNA (guanosine(46)-N7)-methyltransferase TrmB [Bacilli bacterium]
MRLRNVKNKDIIMNNSTYLVKNYYELKGKWSKYFNNNNPIYIEIGMGKGKFIIENAIKYPNINFIGIEKYDSVIAKALKKIPEGLNNLVMLRCNALDIDQVFDHEIEHIFLNFSDPWPKNRHHLRRLSSKVFLTKYDSIFKKDKTIEMRTDNRELFEYSLVSFSEYGYVLNKVSLDFHKEEVPEITTEYEDKFSSEGLPIYYLLCSKGFVKKRK